MAQHKVTELVAEALALGLTRADLDRVVSVMDFYEDGEPHQWVNGVGDRASLYEFVEKARGRAERADRVTQMWQKVVAGEVLFTKSAQGVWLIWGRTELLEVGSTVTATRANGSTSTVRVTGLQTPNERDGVSYVVATFANVTDPAAAARPAAQAATSTPRNWSFEGQRRSGRPSPQTLRDQKRGYTIDDDGGQHWDYA